MFHRRSIYADCGHYSLEAAIRRLLSCGILSETWTSLRCLPICDQEREHIEAAIIVLSVSREDTASGVGSDSRDKHIIGPRLLPNDLAKGPSSGNSKTASAFSCFAHFCTSHRPRMSYHFTQPPAVRCPVPKSIGRATAGPQRFWPMYADAHRDTFQPHSQISFDEWPHPVSSESRRRKIRWNS
jgi:hypothetical protein